MGVPVVEISALKNKNVAALMKTAYETAGKGKGGRSVIEQSGVLGGVYKEIVGLYGDAGCGEGYFAEAVRRTGAAVCAFDISRDSIQLAAGQNAEDGILWFVADLAAIPVQDGAIDAVIDVFSPAHYGEFRRVLAPGGRVIKVVPTAHHLHEVRELAADQLRHSAYSNRRVIDHFAASCRLISRTTVSHTLALTPKVRDALIAMTPLLFSVDAAAIDWSGLTQATVEAEVLVGTW